MDNSWKQQLEEMLTLGMPYAFKAISGQKPTLDDAEFYGDEHEAGFFDQFLNLVRDLRKKAFYSGFIAGAKACHLDNGKDEEDFNEDISRHGASDAWELFEEEERGR